MDALRADVVVIGAGLAGLTAALHLAERGLHPLVLEADPETPGGRLKRGPTITLTHAGRNWTFAGEHGVHAVWSGYRNLQAMLARHHIRPVLVPAQEEMWLLGRGQRVRRVEIGSAIRGSWTPAPLHYLSLFARPRFWAVLSLRDIAALFRVFATLLAALAIDPLMENQPLPGLSLADLCRGWSPNLTTLFTGLSRNALPVNPDRMPASGFIAFLRFYTLRRRDAWTFAYLPDESGDALIAPLVAKVRHLGGAVRLGARIVHLERADGMWQVGWADGEVRSASVVLAVDVPAARQLLTHNPTTAPQAARLRWPSAWPSAIVRLWFRCKPRPGTAEAGIFSGEGFVLDNFFWLDRLYNDYIRWGRATGGSALEAHIYGPPTLLAEADAALIAEAVVEATRAWPELRGNLLHAALTRNDATHTLLSVGRPSEHLGVVTPWPGLYACGDWVRAPSPAMFMERACVTAIQAANAVLRDRDLPPWPLLPPPPPEPLADLVEGLMRRVRAWMRMGRLTDSGGRPAG